jgi:hypothetical protein
MLHSFAQENSTANNNEVKKYAYQFMGEVSYPQTGATFHFADSYYYDNYPVNWNLFRIGLHIINNMVYKEKISIGLGTGWEYTLLGGDMGFPVFADFRYYFTEKKFRPFIDIGIGTIITIYSPYLELFGDKSNKKFYMEKPGLYFNCTGGFKYKHFQFHAGINMRTNKSMYHDIYSNTISLDFVIKCGFNL